MPTKNSVDPISSGMARLRVDDGSSKSASKRSALGSMMQQELKDIPASSPYTQDDGSWNTVTSNKRPSAKQPPPQTGNGNRQRTISFVEPPRPARASPGKSSIYEPRNRQSTFIKQSCLPVGDRNPDLLEIEQQANRSKIYHKDEFRPGMIIRGVLHEQDYIATSSKSNITILDKNRSDTRYGPICTKWRKMIVLKLFEDHYTAIPLFTHNGKGLENKRAPDEFVSIRDHRAKEDAPRLSRHKPLRTATIKDGIELFSVKSTAHITYALPRKYNLPIIKEGELLKGSLNNLIYLFNKYAPRELPGVVRDA
ncbi:MAG: hypothetical protein Q9225_002700 [Loekoesia sp. 1 TL-2023]